MKMVPIPSQEHTCHIFQTHTMRSERFNEILNSNQEDFSGEFFAVKYQHFQCEQANCHYFNVLKLIINMFTVNMQSAQTLAQLSNFATVKT